MSTINDLTFSDDECDTSFIEEPNSSIIYEDDESSFEDDTDDFVEDIKDNLMANQMTKLKVQNEFHDDPYYDEDADETYSFMESDDSDGEEPDFEEVFDKKANEEFWKRCISLYQLPEMNH
ncbi:hypothetical protein C7M61_000300 [Candidozyma pseudohaemuli]|uniref:Uncharacterized protein n=1 Tax=Candidozyma pseudohaemuli TaxID=418784 RepID=A0A2P7YXH8_9ASCO|nr:hypothetical protein C7M61_000300 [[Candida] pseudohaemulonii]PSK40652.1 hypothetical protein C7M61_000300 [[Candida] pseudohaemulonii]